MNRYQRETSSCKIQDRLLDYTLLLERTIGAMLFHMIELLCFSVTGYINLPCCSFFCIILNNVNVNAIDFSERFFPDSILSTQKEGQMSERPVKQTTFVPTPPINRITTKQMLGKISVSPLSKI